MIVNNEENSYGQDDQRVDAYDDQDISSGSVSDDDDNELQDDDDDDVETVDAYPGEKQEEEPDEIPEKHVSENESSEYPKETEFTQPERGSDASYSEQVDVTPPASHEFPSVGNAQTDFVSRDHGRTTGRMVGHEPGTEGI